MAKRKTGARREAKSIILFSDGTGNSSAKLFKTNVWRMYEAVDLGPAEAGKQNQIAFYDDGVGTSSFRPLALLGGIFGTGQVETARATEQAKWVAYYDAQHAAEIARLNVLRTSGTLLAAVR